MQAILFAVLAGVCWGVGEFFTKQVLHSKQVGPMAILAIRALVTVPPALLAYFIATSIVKSEKADWFRHADGAVLAKLGLGSALMAGFGGVFFFYLGLAAAGGDISRVKPIAFTLAPAIAALLAWKFLGETLTATKLFAIALILVGVFLLTAQSGARPPSLPSH